MVMRYLKSLMFVLMFGGLVGPLFLIIYFVFETSFDRQSTGWMLLAGVVITVADVLVALAVSSFSAKSAAKQAALERDGVLTLAQITAMKETGTQINDRPVVKLDLRITGPGFAFAVQKRVIASFDRMGNLNARKLVVLVDPGTNEYQIDWERSTLVNGLVSATFTLADDNQTYDLTGQAEPLMEILQIFKANGITASGSSDLRSADPALRRQLQDVVRRAVAAQLTDTPEFMPPRPSAAQRLQELAGLHANEAITDDEYRAKRQQIISEI